MDASADDAHQSLWPESDGPAGARFSDEEHGSIPLQDRRRGRRRHHEEGNDHMVTSRCLAVLAFTVTASCASSRSAPSPVNVAPAPTTVRMQPVAWTDSLLATLSLRDKA